MESLIQAQKLIADVYLRPHDVIDVVDDLPREKIIDGKKYVLITPQKPKTTIKIGMISILTEERDRMIFKVGSEVVHLFSVHPKFETFRSNLKIISFVQREWRVEVYESSDGNVLVDIPES